MDGLGKLERGMTAKLTTLISGKICFRNVAWLLSPYVAIHKIEYCFCAKPNTQPGHVSHKIPTVIGGRFVTAVTDWCTPEAEYRAGVSEAEPDVETSTVRSWHRDGPVKCKLILLTPISMGSIHFFACNVLISRVVFAFHTTMALMSDSSFPNSRSYFEMGTGCWNKW